MNVYVPMQAVFVPLVVGAVALACGHQAGLALLVAVTVGVLVWLGFAIPYALRVQGRDDERRGEDRRALAAGALGLLAPAAIATVVWRSPGYTGLLFSTQAAAFAGVALAVIPIAILASSMVDWYLIIPFCYGAFGEAIWVAPTQRIPLQRRRYAKIWVAHRMICEICCYFALALIISILFVAVGNAVSHERTLPVALESLGGSGIAFAVLGYLGPRVRDSWNYMLADNAGLGTWAEGTDNAGEHVEGLIVDVSVHPGVKLWTKDEKWRFVPLKLVAQLYEYRSARPPQCDAGWCEQAVRRRKEAKKPEARHNHG
jgi:hypothetical protein